MGRRPKWTFLQGRHIDGQEAHKKMLNIANYQRNANQNYSEVPLYTTQKGHHQKTHKQDFPDGSVVKKPPVNAGEAASVTGLGRSHPS